jgi:DivIVA domain-containing protein
VNSTLTAKDIQGVRFSKSSQGYSPVAVDRFLLQVEARLQGGGALSATEVRNLAFRRPSLSGWGYDQAEVDDLKDQIAGALAELEARG